MEKQEAGEVLGRENSSVCALHVCVCGGVLTKGAKSWLVQT